MKRRGFLGALTAALAASRVLPAKASDVVLEPSAKPMLASGVVWHDVKPITTIMPPHGMSILMKDGTVQHLGEYGKLVAVTNIDGSITVVE